MTLYEAKRQVKAKLLELGFVNRVTARTVGFQDLLRRDAVVITVHDWCPPVVGEARVRLTMALKDAAPGGCLVTFEGPGIA